MNMYTIIGILVFIVGVLCFGAFVLLIIKNVPIKYYKTGKLVFNTDKEYENFKYAIGHKNVDLIDISVVASPPPIVAKYKVEYPISHKFDYDGDLSVSRHKYFDSLYVLAFISAMSISMGLVFIYLL